MKRSALRFILLVEAWQVSTAALEPSASSDPDPRRTSVVPAVRTVLTCNLVVAFVRAFLSVVDWWVLWVARSGLHRSTLAELLVTLGPVGIVRGGPAARRT